MSRLPQTLAALCLLGGLATAQAEEPKPIPDPDHKGGLSPDQIEEIERGRVQADQPVDGADVGGTVRIPKNFGIQINCEQDPYRIAPGETGKLVLFVMLPKHQKGAAPAGSIQWPQNLDDMKLLSFGPPSFDPPKDGRNTYGDSFVVTVPVTVQPRAEHRRYSFSGTLNLSGSFSSAAGPEEQQVIDEAGAARGDGASPPPVAIQTSNKAEISFSGILVVGPPVPKPGVMRGGASGPEPGAAGQKPRSPAQPPQGAAGGPSEAGGQPGAGDVRFGSEGSGPVSGGIESGEGAAAPSSGDPDLILKIGGVLVALVLLILIFRAKGSA